MKPEQCAYKQIGIVGPSLDCAVCDGFPIKGCHMYTTKDHIKNWYDKFKIGVDKNETEKTER